MTIIPVNSVTSRVQGYNNRPQIAGSTLFNKKR